MSSVFRPHGGDRVARVLERHGVRFLFTLCGGHISPILVAAKARGIRVVDTRHEVNAVFAADAVARLTGVPGVAAVTAGPGVTNAVTALKNAQMAQSPLVLLGGATATVLKGRGALQDIDQLGVVRSLVKKAWLVRRVRDIEPVLTEAFSTAASGVPGPVFVELPVDLLYPEEMVRGWYKAKTEAGKDLTSRAVAAYLRRHLNKTFDGADAITDPRPRALEAPTVDEGAVARAAGMLAACERPVLVLGSGAMQEPGEAAALAEAVSKLGVPVYLAGMGRGLLGKGHALQLRHRRREALKQADLVLLAGFPSDFRLDYGSPIRRSTKLLGIHRSRHDLRLNRKPTLGVVGDPGRFLRRLAERAPGAERWAHWLQTLKARDAEKELEIDGQAEEAGDRVNPLAFFRALEPELAGDSVLVADGGDFVATAAYTLSPRGPLSWLDPGVFGTLGVGAGFALGAKLVRPQAEVWLIYGDGSCGYSLAEFDTFTRHGLGLVAVVGNDASWAQIAREQVEVLGDAVGTELASTAYHEAAAGFGGVGLEIHTNEEIRPVLAQAKKLASQGRAVLVNVYLAKTEFRKGSISI